MAEQGNWTLVFSAGSVQEAELVKGRLEGYDIPALLMDKSDHAYPQLSEVGVYVERDMALRALHVLNGSGEA